MAETEIEEALRRELVEEIKADLDLSLEQINGREYVENVTLPVCAITQLERQGKVAIKF